MTLWFNGAMLRIRLILSTLIFLLASCAPAATPTMFRPPTEIPPTQPLPTITTIPLIYTAAPTVTLTPTVEGPCTNDLQFLEDITIADNTVVLPNSAVDKQWLVQNTGTCDWDSTYHLKWLGGDPLGAVQEQPLYPARAGTQAVLRIVFIAPGLAGTYESSWQAVAPDGNVFGDSIYIKVSVSE